MSLTTLRRIEFHGRDIEATQDDDGRVWVVLKRICENLGIDSRSQRKKIQDNPAFMERWGDITLPSSGGAQETFCIDLDALALWLGSISAAKVKKSVRESLIQYQREAMAVLREHFFGSPSPHRSCSCGCGCSPQRTHHSHAYTHPDESHLIEQNYRAGQDRATTGRGPQAPQGPYLTKDDLAPLWNALRSHNESLHNHKEVIKAQGESIAAWDKRLTSHYRSIEGAMNYARDAEDRAKEAVDKAEEAHAIAHAVRSERDQLALAFQGIPGPGRLPVETVSHKRLRAYVSELVLAGSQWERRTKKETWDDLLRSFRHIHSIDLKVRARNKEMIPVEYAEKHGYIEKLYELAYFDIAVQCPNINQDCFPKPRTS